jgi:hypothetical protein
MTTGVQHRAVGGTRFLFQSEYDNAVLRPRDWYSQQARVKVSLLSLTVDHSADFPLEISAQEQEGMLVLEAFDALDTADINHLGGGTPQFVSPSGWDSGIRIYDHDDARPVTPLGISTGYAIHFVTEIIDGCNWQVTL